MHVRDRSRNGKADGDEGGREQRADGRRRYGRVIVVRLVPVDVSFALSASRTDTSPFALFGGNGIPTGSRDGSIRSKEREPSSLPALFSLSSWPLWPSSLSLSSWMEIVIRRFRR